jgi:hypothetical protein
VYGNPRGLVDHQKVLVLKNDRSFDQLLKAARGTTRLARGLDPHGRKPHLIPGDHAVLRVHTLAIDAHFALA